MSAAVVPGAKFWAMTTRGSLTAAAMPRIEIEALLVLLWVDDWCCSSAVRLRALATCAERRCWRLREDDDAVVGVDLSWAAAPLPRPLPLCLALVLPLAPFGASPGRETRLAREPAAAPAPFLGVLLFLRPLPLLLPPSCRSWVHSVLMLPARGTEVEETRWEVRLDEKREKERQLS